MTEQTGEKLATQLDKLRFAVGLGDLDDPAWRALADYLEQSHAELAGRIAHVDDNTHRLLQLVTGLVDELETWRPLLNMLRPNGGTSQPDWISVGQAVRTARREAKRNGGDQRAGAPRGSAARRGIAGRQLPDAQL